MEGVVRVGWVVPREVAVNSLDVESEQLLSLIRNREKNLFELFHLLREEEEREDSERYM